MLRLLLGLVMACLVLAPAGARAAEGDARSVIEWVFDKPGDLKGWVSNGQMKDVRVQDGALQGEVSQSDPFFTSPLFDIPATPWQSVEIRMKANKAGHGDLFYSNTLESAYEGFFPGKQTGFDIPGDGEWHTIRLEPFWQAEKKIIHIRLDLGGVGQVFAVQSIRILEPAGASQPHTEQAWDFGKTPDAWSAITGVGAPVRSGNGIAVEVKAAGALLRSPILSVPIEDQMWVSVRMRAKKGSRASLAWITDKSTGMADLPFPIYADGRFHTYNLDVGGTSQWSGTLLALGLRPSHMPGDRVEIEAIRLEKDAVGGPDLEIAHFGLEDAVNRVGKPCRLRASFLNNGAATATGVKATLELPAGVTARAESASPEFEFQVPGAFRWVLTASRPVQGQATLRLSGPGAPAQTFTAPIRITQGPKVAKASYVPAPKPARTKYQVGCYYFPGWESAYKWECIERVAPIRKPVLGYYDEANPECADWQIKWAVEHGVTFFLLDWYWSAGGRHLEHWLHQAYMNSRYRKDLKWCLMWANHNAPKTHSVEDWRKVTQYWIDNYFGMPEYLRVDGKPIVFIWAPYNIRRDVGGSAEVAKLFAMSQEMVKQAGYPGVTFAAMNTGGSPEEAKLLASEGYVANTSYHWFADAPQKAADSRYFPYSLVVDRSRQAWEKWTEAAASAGMKYLPVADSGWDSRPWHGDKSMVIHSRTPAQWERLLREAKSFLDARNEKMLVLGPCNEWGEGSYLEPCAEYGFGMYDAVRRVFCDEPAAHTDLAPVDVGLGPYDFPMAAPVTRSEWTFDKAGDTEGWSALMGMSAVVARDGALYAKTLTRDPAFTTRSLRLRASKYRTVVLKMKVASPTPLSREDSIQLFWSTPNQSASEASSVSVPLIADGGWHTYELPVGENPRWRGVIQSFRLDPGNVTDLEVWIDEVRLK